MLDGSWTRPCPGCYRRRIGGYFEGLVSFEQLAQRRSDFGKTRRADKHHVARRV